MSDYYEVSAGARPRRRRRTLVGLLLHLLSVVCSVAVAVAMILTLAAPYVRPEGTWFFPVLGLAAPATYIATVLLALYWIVRWRWRWASLLLLLAVVGLFKLSLFYKPEFRRHLSNESLLLGEEIELGGKAVPRDAIRLMTYNVRNFYADDGSSSVPQLLRFVSECDPDIVCMQEFNASLADGDAAYGLFRESYPYAAGGAEEQGGTASMALFSKFRILQRGVVRGGVPEGEGRESLWADLLLGDDTVRLFCNHLHSTAITADDNEFFVKHRYISDTTREERIRSIVRRFSDNCAVRAEQADSVAAFVAGAARPRIVCGDFNDTPMSYVYRTMSRGLQDAFRACGSGYSHTFRGFFNLLRIDFVLSSPELEPITYEVPEVEYSDHLPVVVQFAPVRR